MTRNNAVSTKEADIDVGGAQVNGHVIQGVQRYTSKKFLSHFFLSHDVRNAYIGSHDVRIAYAISGNLSTKQTFPCHPTFGASCVILNHPEWMANGDIGIFAFRQSS